MLTPANYRRLATTALCAAAVVVPAWAADDPNPYTLGIEQTLTHDSNVFRAPSGPLVSSDWISTTGLVGSIDQPIGRERLKANGEFDINRFKNNSQLNSNAHSFNVEGDWETIDRLSGELAYFNSSELYRYNSGVTQIVTEKNTLDTQRGYARFHLGSVTRLTLDAALEGYEQQYSSDVYRYQDLRRWFGSLGASYAATPDLRTSLTYRQTRGSYPHYFATVDENGDVNTVADDFRRHDIVFGLSYDATGVSVFRLNISRATETHSQISSRSYGTWAFDGGWTWTPTGKTQLVLDFLRDDNTGAQDISVFGLPLATSDAQRRTAIQARLTYALSAKVRVNAGAAFAKRDLDTAFAGNPDAGTTGSDRLYQVSLGADWQAARWLSLGCNVAREKRTASGESLTVVTYPYNDTTFACTGQVAFH